MTNFNKLRHEDLQEICEDQEQDLSEKRAAIIKARDLAYHAPELNMNNFNSDDVDKLNDAMIEVFSILDDLA